MAKRISQMDRSKLINSSESLMKEFDSSIDVYKAFCGTTADLIKRLLASKQLTVHSISSRCKGRASLEKKIIKKAHYRNLLDITDLAGIRIITHYSDDVDVIANLIEKEFDIDKSNSIDKRTILDPDRFGYLSLHYVASLKKTRSKLQEYADYDGLKIEIQIRSILQHTWAEIEHDIGYKNEIEVPGPIKRKFSRLAGLLELADQEFISIRKEIDKYSKSLDKQISSGNKSIGLDAVSFEKFVTLSPASMTLDSEVHKIGNYRPAPFDNETRLVKRLVKAGISTIDALTTLLSIHREDILRMVSLLRNLPDEDGSGSNKGATPVAPGISSFFLLHVLIAKKTRTEIVEYLEENDWLRTPGGEDFLETLVNFFQ